VNLRQLSYFLQIAELQSFTRAASVLHVSQPSLSKQIQLLEHELGVLLFLRSDKGVTLTEAGNALQERATNVVHQVRQIRNEIGEQALVPRGELAFGVPPSLFDLVTVPLVRAFRKRYPEVHLCVTEGLSSSMHEMVLTGKLDTAVVSDAEPLSSMRSQPLLKEQLYFVGSSDAALVLTDPVSVQTMASHKLMLTSSTNAVRQIVDRALAEVGRWVMPVVQANSSRLLCELAAQGEAFTVLPYSAIGIALRDGRLSAAPIENMYLTWTMITPSDRSQTLVGRKLRETIFEIAHERISEGSWCGIVAVD
jgi:LysR family transcriptional regulator, nitrogen assimilation regulatory protein